MSSAWDGPLVSLKEVLLILGMFDSSVWHRIRYNKYQQKVENSKTKMGIEETHERWRRGILTTSNVEQQVIDMRLYIEVRFGFEKNIEK